MASSRYLISSQTLGSAAATVTFSSIPATYTDLVVRISARSSYAGYYTWINLRMNNLSTAIYSFRDIFGTPGTAGSFGNYGNTEAVLSYINANNSTANTFSSTEYYIPSYNANQNKPMSNFSVQESNSATAYQANIGASANLMRDTGAITRLDFFPQDGSFMTGSSFYLYGLKNS